MRFIIKILKTFDYHSITDFLKSLLPTLKYEHITILTIWLSYTGLIVDKIFGMSAIAFLAFVAIMLGELISGIWAAKVKEETFSSMKLSRFSFKMACYLLLIAVPYILSVSYRAHGSDMAAAAFDWLHIFLVMQVVFENTISILENIGIITGKEKTFWIKKIQEKIKSF